MESNIPAEKIPKKGMEFDTEDAAYNFYNEYAKLVGFSVRKHKAHVDSNHRILDRIFCCSKQGHRMKDKRDVNVKTHRPETRTSCNAMMKINGRHYEKYIISDFIAEHNGHELVSPSKSFLLRSHRHITLSQASQVNDLETSGIAPKSGFTFMAKQMGDRRNVGFILEDYKNYLRSKRSVEMKIGDTGGVLEYLQRRQLNDPNFFGAIQVDEDDLITNILWMDAQMKSDYDYFGDVVCFDTTYRKNKEGRPFALFVGVNHHKQTIIFGAALLYDETTSTFNWLFDTFAKAMSGKKPKTILTDQDAAMAKALAMEWPETCHRLCIWHINQNAAVHLNHVFARFTGFSADFSSCIYDYEVEEDFLNAWHDMLEKYGLQSNEWLERLFKIKEKWALVYGRQSFCADMTTTQRSESMNSILKRYVNYKNNLLQFFEYFDRLIDDRRFEELKSDLKTSQSTPVVSFSIQILKHAATVYTYPVFKLFEKELSKAYDSNIELYSDSEEVSLYKVKPFGKRYQFLVSFHSSRVEVSCSCRKFEFAGILCSHALKVLSLKQIVEIPALYIMKRWTKKAKLNMFEGQSTRASGVSCVPDNEKGEKELMRIHYRELCSLNNRLTTRAALTKGTFEIVKKGILTLIDEVDTHFENAPVNKTTFGSKSDVQSDLLSSLLVNQTRTMKSSERLAQEDEQVSKELLIKGLKVKEKRPLKSGKRPKSGLETRARKKKQNNTNHVGNNVQIIDNMNNILNTSTSFKENSFLVQNSQTYQARNYEGSFTNLLQAQNQLLIPLGSSRSNYEIREDNMRKKLESHVEISNRAMHYLGYFPSYIQKYIVNIVDVQSDGHCGFRAIASLLGFGEDFWLRVRNELIDELCNNENFYGDLYGSLESVAKLREALAYFFTPAPYKNWMVLPDMGHLIASRYNVVLIHISEKQCLTYLPLRTNPLMKSQQKIISIGYVSNHFVQVFLDDHSPIPPIVPNWKHFRLDSAAGWDNLYSDRIKDFIALLPVASDSLRGKIITLEDS